MPQRRNRRRPRMVTDEAIFSLHKYYLRATNMLKHYTDAVKRAEEAHGAEWRNTAKGTTEYFDILMYMDLWYAGLFVVIEGYEKLGLSDPSTERLLASDLVSKLRLYRQGVYHYQAKYYAPEHSVLATSPKTVAWAKTLYMTIGKFLLIELATRREKLQGR